LVDLFTNEKLLNASDKVRFFCYDVNMENSPPGVEFPHKLPKVIFYPAYRKD